MARAKGCDQGELRHRIRFESFTKASDGQGGTIPTWTTFNTVWAKVVAAPKPERNFAGQLQTQRTHKITVRYLADIDPSMRIVNIATGSTYQIKSIIQVDDQRFWQVIDVEENQGT